jgi:FkbM family methyltransferase
MIKISNPLVQFISRKIRARGFDIVWYRPANHLLAYHGINLVLDGGANVGQYATELRRQGYRGKILSFEPQPVAFQELEKNAAADGNWSAMNIGLGDVEGELAMNLCVGSDCGSFLKPVAGINPYTATVGQKVVPVRRLDRLWKDICTPAEKVFLKLDTQGYEQKILNGAESCLNQIIGVQLELSLRPFYEGQPNWEEMLYFMRQKGFVLWKVETGSRDAETGRECEIDGIFFRDGLKS